MNRCRLLAALFLTLSFGAPTANADSIRATSPAIAVLPLFGAPAVIEIGAGRGFGAAAREHAAAVGARGCGFYDECGPGGLGSMGAVMAGLHEKDRVPGFQGATRRRAGGGDRSNETWLETSPFAPNGQFAFDASLPEPIEQVSLETPDLDLAPIALVAGTAAMTSQATVPEPATLLLTGCGLASLAAYTIRRRRQRR